MKTAVWQGCYDENLKGLITAESFAHPAKMAKRLCERIFEYGAEQGYWRPGDVIVDPFGGIGTTGIIGAYRGYRVVSIELEARFVELQRANIERNRGKLERLGMPLPVVVQGDARRLSALLAEHADGSIFSPPYADGSAHTGGDDLHPERMTGGKFVGVGLNGAISSPPYSDSINGGEGPGARYDFVTHSPENAVKQTSDAAYGIAPGQIGALREGDFDGVITSPPYSGNVKHDYTHDERDERRLGEGFTGRGRGSFRGSENYGATDGQIGAEFSETYWQAMAQVYGELYRVLAPAGVAAIVVKDFVRNKQRVPLCDRTAQLLETIGFTVIERTRAMLVKETYAGQDMFSGEHRTKRTERKGFFRRLAEKKGSPAIDWEEVVWGRKKG